MGDAAIHRHRAHLLVVQQPHGAALAGLHSLAQLGHLAPVGVLSLQEPAVQQQVALFPPRTRSRQAFMLMPSCPNAPVAANHLLRQVARHVIEPASGSTTSQMLERPQLGRRTAGGARCSHPSLAYMMGSSGSDGSATCVTKSARPSQLTAPAQPPPLPRQTHHKRVVQPSQRDAKTLGCGR